MLSARGSQLRRASYDARNFHKSSLDSSVNIVTRLQADNPGSIPARGKERASSLTCPHRPSDSPSRVLLPEYSRMVVELINAESTVGGAIPLHNGLHRDNSGSFRHNMCLN